MSSNEHLDMSDSGCDDREGNCRRCEGTGTDTDDDGVPRNCPTCDGTGWVDDDPQPEMDDNSR
jgi:DnaJ-class molecular chaperone